MRIVRILFSKRLKWEFEDLTGNFEISPETHIFSNFFNGNLTFSVLAIKGTEKGVVEPYPRDLKG